MKIENNVLDKVEASDIHNGTILPIFIMKKNKERFKKG